VASGDLTPFTREFCLEPGDRRLAARPVRHLFGQDTYELVLKKGRALTAAAKNLAAELLPDLESAIGG